MQPFDLPFENGLRPLIQIRALAGEDLAIDDCAFDTRRAVERRILHVPRLFAEDARSSFSSGVSWVSPLGVTLPTRMSPGFTVAPMRMMPLSSRLRRKLRRCSEYRA